MKSNYSKFFSLFVSVIVSSAFLFGCQKGIVSTNNLSVHFNEKGEIESIITGDSGIKIPLSGMWKMEGCSIINVKTSQTKGMLTITKNWKYENREFKTTEVLTPNNGNIRWKFTLKDDNKGFWSVPIKTSFNYPATENTRYWTAWSDPRQGTILEMSREELVEKHILTEVENANTWADPFVMIPMQNSKLWYGEDPYSLDTNFYMFGLRDEQKNITCIPMLSIFEPDQDLGFTVVQSLDDLLLQVSVETSEDGKIEFSRETYRIGEGKEVSFSMNIIAHDAGLLAGLKGVSEIYADYFTPQNPEAKEMTGMWNYTRDWGNFNMDFMKEIGFKTTWKASHDLPWMGMFIPPVDETEKWKGFERNKGNEDDYVSIPKMREYSEMMVKNGFRVLNYMNVCEMGAYVAPTRPVGIDEIQEKDLWKNSDAYMYRHFEDAFLPRTSRKNPEPTYFYSWRKCIGMDCGDPAYQDFLVNQIERHIELFPASSGFNVDRLDWLRIYNVNKDDGVSWFDNKPARSLNWAYKQLMNRVWPILQKNNKYWFLDTNGARIDFMNQADGIFQENNAGQTLNCNAVMTIKKPFGAWFKDEQLKGKTDAEIEVWLQNYLYVAAWPLAPFPENDHSLSPNPQINRIFLDYAPLFKTLYGKEWVLESYAYKKSKDAKINMFKTDLGYSIPVVFASNGLESITVEVKKEYVEGKTIEIIRPGIKTPITAKYTLVGDYAKIEVPVSRSCAVVVLK